MFNLALLENANMRMVQVDGTDIFSLHDFLEHALKNNAKDKEKAARNYWIEKVRTDEQFRDEVAPFITETRFQRWDDTQGKYMTSRGPKQVGITLQGLLHVTNLLGSKISAAFRHNTMEILRRYLDGDTSMCIEIQENKAMGPVQSYTKFLDKCMTDAHEQTTEFEPPVTKYVYAFHSEAFPGWVKLGKTNSTDARLKCANVFAAPSPFKLLAVAPTLDYTRDENRMHQHFAAQRGEGEFFKIGHDEACAFLNTIAESFQKELFNIHLRM